MNFARDLRHLFSKTLLEKNFAGKLERTWEKILLKHFKKKSALLTSTIYVLLLLKNLFVPLFTAFYNMLKARAFRNNAVQLRIYLIKKIIFRLR